MGVTHYFFVLSPMQPPPLSFQIFWSWSLTYAEWQSADDPTLKIGRKNKIFKQALARFRQEFCKLTPTAFKQC